MTDSPGEQRPLRILVLNWLDRENPKAGGAETHLHEVFGRLAGRGHQVTALVSGWRGCERRARLDGIEIHRSGSRYSFSLTAPAYFRRHLSSGDFDVVVEDLNKVPLFSPLWVGAPAVLLTHHLFGATAFQAGSPPVALATVLLERPIPLVYRHTPAIAVSESTKADLVRRGLSVERIEVIPNGLDVNAYTPDPAARAERPTLVFLGRLKKYKRVDLVIDAVHALAERGTHVDLEVAGEGEEEAALRGRVRRLGLEDRVRLLGHVDDQEKLALLRRGWVHVLTSPKEGWGITNLEAAACGTPSIASDAPGLRESVVDGRTGLLVPHGDVAAVADAIERLVTDPELRTSMGKEARAYAETFSWEAAADAFEAYLRRLVEHSVPD